MKIREKIKIKYFLGIKSIFLAVFIMLFMYGCGGAKTSNVPQNFDELREFANNKQFEIQNEWAMPLGQNQINLIGNPNFIRFQGDSVNLFLPYFGVRHSGGGYGGEAGIEYKGPAKDLQIIEQAENKKVIVKFEGQQGTENLDFIVTLYPKGNVSTSVTSSQRNSISYRGFVRPLPENLQ